MGVLRSPPKSDHYAFDCYMYISNFFLQKVREKFTVLPKGEQERGCLLEYAQKVLKFGA